MSQMVNGEPLGVSIEQIRWHPQRGVSAPITTVSAADRVPDNNTVIAFAGYATSIKQLVRMHREFREAGHDVLLVDLPFTDKALRGNQTLVGQLAMEGPHDVINELQLTEPPMLGHSKGASVVGRSLALEPANMGDIMLVQPPEIQEAFVGATEKDTRGRIRGFERAIVLSLLDQHLSRRGVGAIGEILRTYVTDKVTGQFDVMVGPVMNGSNVVPLLGHIEAGHMGHIVHGDRDRVFRADNSKLVLEQAVAKRDAGSGRGRLYVSVVPGYPHVNGDTREGMELLIFALQKPSLDNSITRQIYPSV